MLLNLLCLGALIFLAYAFFTLFLKSVRSPNWAAKILGGFCSGLLSLVFILAAAAAFYGLWQTSVPRVQAAPQVTVTATPGLISRGQVLGQSCIPCHSFDGSPVLNGGATNLAAVWGPYGQVYARNLTQGGALKEWTDGEVIRAIRQGIDKEGLPLVGHPSGQYAGMSQEDAAALVAYLRSQPALRHDQPERNLNVLGLWAAAAGLLPISEQPAASAAVLTGGG